MHWGPKAVSGVADKLVAAAEVTVPPIARSFPAKRPMAKVPAALEVPQPYSRMVMVVPETTFCNAGMPERSICACAVPFVGFEV